jgi:hypothetical protein
MSSTNSKQYQQSGAKSTDDFTEVAEDATLEPENAVDYREADQGTNVQPKLGRTSKSKKTNKNAKKGKGKKGKGKGEERGSSGAVKAEKGRGPKKTLEEQARCSFCTVSMLNRNFNWHPIDDIQVPKNKDGDYKFVSPASAGVSDGTLAGVFCDDDQRAWEADPSTRDIKTAVVEKRDGHVVNMPISEITQTPDDLIATQLPATQEEEE